MPAAKASRNVVIANTQGMHLRPAGALAKLASQFKSHVELICNLDRVDASSPMMLMSLGAAQGTKLTIEAIGEDAAEAVDALAELVDSFTEMDAELSPDEGALPPAD